MQFSFQIALLVVLGYAASICTASESTTSSFIAGVATQKVVVLKRDTLNTAIKDPANSLWFLKFFAPWCGHCKKLAPVLDIVAPKLAGQMSIGTIDCTVEKKLCDDQNVRGYPTLKFSLDGVMYPYEGGRTERDLIAFSDKIRRPAVELVANTSAAQTFASLHSDNGVAFLAFHPALSVPTDSTTPGDDKLQSTHLTQVFAQVARKQRAVATFLLLDSTATVDDESALAMASAMGQNGPFICRLEANVPPRCYDQIQDADMDLARLVAWVETQNVAIVSRLGPGNFHKIGRGGRPLVIAVVSEQSTEQIETAQRELAAFATAGPTALRDRYYYGWLDGTAWKKFLTQFDVIPEESPQVFCVDVPRKTYWQNSTYKLNVADFLQAIADGSVEAKVTSQQGLEGRLTRMHQLFVDFLPWSAVAAIILFLALVGAIAWCITPGEELRPPYPRPAGTTLVSSDAKPTTTVGSDEPKKKK